MTTPKKTPSKTPAKAAASSSSSSPSPSRKRKGAATGEAEASSSSAAAVAPARVTHLRIYGYVPNLIGYLRAALTAASVYLLYTAPKGKREDYTWLLGLAAYTASFVLDYFDGLAARRLKQSSNFGAVLDMVLDRVSTMLLLVLLGSRLDTDYFFVYAFLAALDYASHWVQMYASKGHHKGAESNKDKNVFVRTFYGVYPFFAYCCAGTEFFYIVRAALYFYDPPGENIERVVQAALLPAAVMKNVINVAQLFSGFEAVAKADAREKHA